MSILSIDAMLFHHTEAVKTPLKDILYNNVSCPSCSSVKRKQYTAWKSTKQICSGIHATAKLVNCSYGQLANWPKKCCKHSS